MRRLLITLTFFCWIFAATSVSAQEGDSTPTPLPTATEITEQSTPQPGLPSIGITYPLDGNILTGIIPITGTITLPGFNLWELSFSYINNPTDTWFILKSGTETLNGEIYTWDTNALTDGDYVLRLRVYFSDAYRNVLVSPVKVRNYSKEPPAPTQTPTITETLPATATTTPPEATITSMPTLRPTPTAPPPNPVILTNEEIIESLLRGASYVALAFFLLAAFYYLLQRFSKRK
jgi:hypothetical protein